MSTVIHFEGMTKMAFQSAKCGANVSTTWCKSGITSRTSFYYCTGGASGIAAVTGAGEETESMDAATAAIIISV